MCKLIYKTLVIIKSKLVKNENKKFFLQVEKNYVQITPGYLTMSMSRLLHGYCCIGLELGGASYQTLPHMLVSLVTISIELAVLSSFLVVTTKRSLTLVPNRRLMMPTVNRRTHPAP